MDEQTRAVAIRYAITSDNWTEAERRVFDTADEAEAWCESQLPEGTEMAWAETQIGMQGSIADLEYEEWEHVWEIAGWDGEGICELEYGE